MGKYPLTNRVASYDQNGQLVKIYKSAKEASMELGVFPRSVDKAIRLASTLKGYHWKRYNSINEVSTTIEIPTTNAHKGIRVKVAMTDENGNVLKTYPSISIAAKENNISPKQIRECLKGHQKKAGGHYWKAL